MKSAILWLAFVFCLLGQRPTASAPLATQEGEAAAQVQAQVVVQGPLDSSPMPPPFGGPGEDGNSASHDDDQEGPGAEGDYEAGPNFKTEVEEAGPDEGKNEVMVAFGGAGRDGNNSSESASYEGDADDQAEQTEQDLEAEMVEEGEPDGGNEVIVAFGGRRGSRNGAPSGSRSSEEDDIEGDGGEFRRRGPGSFRSPSEEVEEMEEFKGDGPDDIDFLVPRGGRIFESSSSQADADEEEFGSFGAGGRGGLFGPPPDSSVADYDDGDDQFVREDDDAEYMKLIRRRPASPFGKRPAVDEEDQYDDDDNYDAGDAAVPLDAGFDPMQKSSRRKKRSPNQQQDVDIVVSGSYEDDSGQPPPNPGNRGGGYPPQQQGPNCAPPNGGGGAGQDVDIVVSGSEEEYSRKKRSYGGGGQDVDVEISGSEEEYSRKKRGGGQDVDIVVSGSYEDGPPPPNAGGYQGVGGYPPQPQPNCAPGQQPYGGADIVISGSVEDEYRRRKRSFDPQQDVEAEISGSESSQSAEQNPILTNGINDGREIVDILISGSQEDNDNA